MADRERPPTPPAELLEFVRALSRSVDTKGGYFPGHSDGVAFLVRMLALEAGADPDELTRLELAAMFHDVGKLMVPDHILKKPDRLTGEEFQVIRRHPVWSAMLAMATDGLSDIAEAVHSHHEHFDGSGYPRGLAGTDIPWAARLILVADAFHVMTSRRPYRASTRRSAALNELQRCAGRQFDPDVVELLVTREKDLPDR